MPKKLAGRVVPEEGGAGRAVGVNTMEKVQLAPVASVAPQVVLCVVKSGPFVPVYVGLPSVTVAPVLFVTVTTLGALVVPCRTVPKETVVGDSVTNPPLVPVSETVSGDPLPPVKTSDNAPVSLVPTVAVGEKSTVIVQDAPFARVPPVNDPQVVESVWKSPPFVPV